MKNESPAATKPADKQLVELSDAQLKQVVGGLNPQPLPPHVEERL